MRELVLTVPRLAVEDVLDRLLPIAPGGVREVPAGRHVELKLRGERLPSPAELERAAGRWPHKLAERDISDDWRVRRRADYRPEVIARRVAIRPEWAPPASPGLTEIVLGQRAAFGAGTHPTTRTCLELLLELPVLGEFADLGCGTGVIALLAAKLGWQPVVAVDIEADSIAAARANATLNSSAIDARLGDLAHEKPPSCQGFAANVPAALHLHLAAAWGGPGPAVGLISGFSPTAAAEVLDAYRQAGFRPRRRIDHQGWTVAELERDSNTTCSSPPQA